MSAEISRDHPIRELFSSLVERSFRADLGLNDPQVTGYLGDVLVSFLHRDRIFCLRNARGMRLEEVAEMLWEGDVALNATSFDRERQVHKHIGDFTLFWTGVYPEMLRLLRSPGRKDHLIDYVEQGRRSYRIASTFQHGPYAHEAPVLGRLAEQFELCVLGLHRVRREMDACGGVDAARLRRLFES
jgi:hypothetical protein